MALATKAKFLESSPFHHELKSEVDRYFKESGQSPRSSKRMYLKTALILSWFVSSYAWLVFGQHNWLTATLGCLSLGWSMAGIGFSVQHDANHGGYSEHKGLNRFIGWTLDIVGGSSYVWNWKHNVFHHSHPNVAGLDADIDIQPFCRVAPAQALYKAHRFQHLYIWFLYGLLAIKWHFIDDFKDLIVGKVGRQKMPRPSGLKWVGIVLGKVLFFGWALVLPLWLHPVWQVALCYALTSFALGVTLASVFQLAHCVEEAHFPELPEEGVSFPRDWAAHQVETTVDFARDNAFVSWYLGGLNFQVVHHLFPRVCHVHYPQLAAIVERTCGKYGVRYRSQQSMTAALGSHVRWLKRMGRPAIPRWRQ